MTSNDDSNPIDKLRALHGEVLLSAPAAIAAAIAAQERCPDDDVAYNKLADEISDALYNSGLVGDRIDELIRLHPQADLTDLRSIVANDEVMRQVGMLMVQDYLTYRALKAGRRPRPQLEAPDAPAN